MQNQRNGQRDGVLDASGEELRRVRLERIVVPDGFNPRGRVQQDRDLAQLVTSIHHHGVLQPLRVRATDHGDLGADRRRAALPRCSGSRRERGASHRPTRRQGR